ncbi:MAG: hemoblobin-interacting domain-containing protein [Marinifilaceae bacterium]
MKKHLFLTCLWALLWVVVCGQTTPPNLTVPSDATVDSDIEITFTENATWRDSITQINYGTDLLPVGAYDVTQAGRIILKPSQSVFLQKAVTATLEILANSFATNSVSLQIQHGAAQSIVIVTQPAGPVNNGKVLATQPVVKLQDQYSNDCTEDSSTSVKVSKTGGVWTLGGTDSRQVTNGTAEYTDLTATSFAAISDATISFSGSGLTTIESSAFSIPAPSAPPGLVASSSANVDSTFEVQFTENTDWKDNLDSIQYDGVLIDPSAWDKSQSGKIIFDPSKDAGLQKAGTAELRIVARGYSDATVNQTIEHGAPKTIVIVTQPAAPIANGGVLATQPAVKLQDQYNNDCTSESSLTVSVVKGDSGNWTLGGTTSNTASDGSVSFTDLTASSDAAISGVYLNFSASGTTTVSSDVFDIPALGDAPVLTAASDATVDSDFEVTFSDNASWRDSIKIVKYGDNELPSAAYDVSQAGKIVLKPSQSTFLQKAGTATILVLANSFADNSVSQEIKHGAATKVVMVTQPVAPANNGAQFDTQPVVKLQDQYSNDCTGENNITVDASASGGTWTLEGTTSRTSNGGLVEHSDLAATSDQAVSNATIKFASTGLTGIESSSFNIPAPSSSPSLTAASNASVDASFEVTFTENQTWKDNIDSVYYGASILEVSSWDKSQSGKIVFDPSKDTDLQKAGTADVTIYSGGFEDSKVSQTIGHGAPKNIVIVTQPTAPGYNGAELGVQPEVKLQDQYNNDCTGENDLDVTVAKGDSGDWTLEGTASKKVTGGSVAYTGLKASSSAAVSGAYLNFSASGTTTISSNTFDIPALGDAPGLTAASNATVDNDFELTFSDNANWRDSIKIVKYGDNELPLAAYDVRQAGKIVLKPSQSIHLQKAGTATLLIVSTSYADNSVSQEIKYGAVTKIVMVTQPASSSNNGGLLGTQPLAKLQDQYSNDCTGENDIVVDATASGGEWLLEGTTSRTASGGQIEHTDLTATSDQAVSNATIKFASTGLTGVETSSFNIPAPSSSPSLTAASGATVDSFFEVTFTENQAWKDNIDSVYYGVNILDASSWDKSQTGKIVFDPARDTDLQKPDTAEIVIYAGGFEDANVSQAIAHGAPKSLVIVAQPKAPGSNGTLLGVQPEVKLQDQYVNDCTRENDLLIAVAKGDSGDWELGGSTSGTVVEGKLAFSDLTATSSAAVSGAYLQFSADGLSNVDSDVFDIPAPGDGPGLTADEGATVDEDIEITFSDNSDWREKVDSITYGGNLLVSASYVLEEGRLILLTALDTLLQKPGTYEVRVVATGYHDNTVSQEVRHGVPDALDVIQQPVPSEFNGDTLAQQPRIQLVDKYQNKCDFENSAVVRAENGDGQDWTLGGSFEVVVGLGVAEYTDLKVSSSEGINDAQIKFILQDTITVLSDVFSIPSPRVDVPELFPDQSATVDSPFSITFTEDSIWRSRIQEIALNDSVLNSLSYDISQVGKIVFDPATSGQMQKADSYTVVVSSNGYVNDSVVQVIGHGATVGLFIDVQPEGPEINGGALVQQPELVLRDQYNNNCVLDTITQVRVEKFDRLVWDLKGVFEKNGVDARVVFSDLIAESEIAIDSAQLSFSFEKDTVFSNTFKIPVPLIELTAADSVTVDQEFVVSFADNASWRDSIQSVSFRDAQLVDTAFRIEPGKLILIPANDTLLQRAVTDSVVVVANGYPKSGVEQKILHGKAAEIVIETQPEGPVKNGDTLVKQPALKLLDQYRNDCENDSTTDVTVSNYSDGSESDVSKLWQLGGSQIVSASKGVVIYSGLTATSEEAIEGARLEFASEGITSVVSDSFNIVVPEPPVITAAVNVDVDNPFVVTFKDNATWRSRITDIKYGIRSLGGLYDVSQVGQITFDPGMVSILQKATTDTMYIYSTGYDTTQFQQTIQHGKAKRLVILKQPTSPSANGEELFRQPELKLQDQYRNDCINDSETPITVSRGDGGDWTLEGFLIGGTVNGFVKYHGLKALSESEILHAKLKFEGTEIIPIESATFTIPGPLLSGGGTASADPTIVCVGSKCNISLKDYNGAIQWQVWKEEEQAFANIEGENSSLMVTPALHESVRYRAKVESEGSVPQYSNELALTILEKPVPAFSFETDFNVVQFDNQSENVSNVLWDFGDGAQSSEFSPVHSYFIDDLKGEGFSVQLRVSNEACPDSVGIQKVLVTSGLDDLVDDSGVVLYPNPNRGKFSLNIDGSYKEGQVRILDLKGQVLMIRQVQLVAGPNQIDFNLDTYSKGVYFLVVYYGDKVLTTRFIIH